MVGPDWPRRLERSGLSIEIGLDSGPSRVRVAELFAGVGGFHLGLSSASPRFAVVWSQQWDPRHKHQYASECYRRHFPDTPHENKPLASILDSHTVPEHDLLVLGLPGNAYSVAKTSSASSASRNGAERDWSTLLRLISDRRPPAVLLECVDRLLRSPTSSRGRDFSCMLHDLASAGYSAEWRVVDGADYGLAQRRRRVFLYASLTSPISTPNQQIEEHLYSDGIFARAFPVVMPDSQLALGPDMSLEGIRGRSRTTKTTNRSLAFENAGIMIDGSIWTRRLTPEPISADERLTLQSVLLEKGRVAPSFYIPDSQLELWRYLKGAKHEARVHGSTASIYYYQEGALPFPDPLDRPSRTVTADEGGSSPRRHRHVIFDGERYRRLTPVELERLGGLPDDHTAGMPDSARARCIGQAPIVGVIERIAIALLQHPPARTFG